VNLESQVEYYARRATEYERIYEKPHRQEELAALKEWIRSAVRQRDVLEIACGTGYWTSVAAETASSIVALDINEPVLEIARSKRLPQSRVRFLQGDVLNVPRWAVSLIPH
jgi:ubiquinone/menaquinone biosynthesis C-methylase UbiE